jgi:hypothetical protein
MTRRSRNHLTAWLGLIAMWLVVAAPLVSQLLAAHLAHESNQAQAPFAALCSTHQPGSQGNVSLAAQRDAAPVHLSHDDAFGACGYCHLLEHHVAVPTVAVVAAPGALVLAGVAPPTLSTRFTPLGAFPSGRPRGPPAFS